MKIRTNYGFAILIILAVLALYSGRLFAEDAPTYRGKVVLVVDKSIASDPDVSWRIERFINDLTGDGWRVLRHDVERGPDLPEATFPTDSDSIAWAALNAPRVREIRALIKADYDAAPTEVKNVFLLGHIPVPYSGALADYVSGGHYTGALPSDTFYGDMTSSYGPGGWTDEASDLSAPFAQVWNRSHDGKFDQSLMPSAMKLGVGRVDLSRMPVFSLNEATLVSRYLDKDHDFRCANFTVPRRFYLTGGNVVTSGEEAAFGSDNIATDYLLSPAWFVDVSQTNYLQGAAYGAGFNENSQVGAPVSFFLTDSRVVFVNLHNSFSGNWETENDLLRAVLCNPYDPINGRYGYGLSAAWGDLGLDDASLSKRTLGATIGEAIFNGYTDAANFGLMGDPTLRMHSVPGPSNVMAAATASSVTLNWGSSPDGGVSGYNIYSAPTRKGPYTLVNAGGGAVSGNSYNATRPASGNPPDNFYMVRAVKTEQTPIGNYLNMSEGVIIPVSSTLTPYIAIESQPISRKVAAHTVEGIANSTVFTVEAVGSDAVGNQHLFYQWYKDGALLIDNGNFVGTTTSSLLIRNVQSTDAGSYYVVVRNSGLYNSQTETGLESVTSSTVTLTISDPPSAAGDSYTIVRNTPTDLNVLANDTDPDDPNSALTLVSVSALSDPSAGVLTINADQRTVHFLPAQAWLGTVTFTYIMSDGVTPAQATVTIDVGPTPGNWPPNVSSIGSQQMTEDTILDVPFTVGDDISSPDNLTYVATCTDPVLIPDANFSFSGTGANRILHIKGGVHQFGSGWVTMTVTDEDAAPTTLQFRIGISPLNVPTLLTEGFQSDGFHFEINGPTSGSVEIKESDDLKTWTSLGNFVLAGNSYEFVDTAAGSASHRFYSAANENGCSANITGFYKVTLPENSGTAVVANQLINLAGDTIEMLFAGVPGGTTVAFFDPATQLSDEVGYNQNKVTGQLQWNPSGATLQPGQGVKVTNPSSTPFTVTFVGDVPGGTQVNGNFPTTVGYQALISSIIPRPGNLTDLGFPAREGDVVFQLAGPQPQWNTFTYSGGAWSPSTPQIGIGESFWLKSGSSASRTWTENLSTCSPEVSVTTPKQGTTFVGSPSISLTATATADSGIAQVQFFQGSTLLGTGAQNGTVYTFTWNSPVAGAYAITAHATDNDGITTISIPVNITVNQQLSLTSESYSAGNFQFTINGSPGVSVEVNASDDLATWSSLGTVTLTGGTYVYTDSAGALTHRFYRVDENGFCSVNTIGFYQVTLAANNGTTLVANQLNNPAGNALEVLFAGVPLGSQFFIWDTGLQAYTTVTYNQNRSGQLTWNPTGVTLDPGHGALAVNPSSTPYTVTFVGDVPEGTQVNGNFSTAVGHSSVVSSIIPRAGSLTDLGFPAQQGDVVYQQSGPQPQYNTFTYSGGVWSPSTPQIGIGECFWVQSGSSASRSWTENLLPCQ